MRVDKAEPGVIDITLSQRNLETLLSKVTREGSERTLYSDGEDGFPLLIVHAETDDEHYSGRTAPPGPVHPLDDPDLHPVDEPEVTA